MRTLPDMQQSKDGFPRIRIQKVGMRHIRVPLRFLVQDVEKEDLMLLADISSYCDLVDSVKGINMSRITRTIIATSAEYSELSGIALLELIAERLEMSHETNHIYVKARVDFPYWTTSPKTELDSPEVVPVTFEIRRQDGVNHSYVEIEATEMSLCPCSKEMSKLFNNITSIEHGQLRQLSNELYRKLERAGFGAHNQKSRIRIKVELLADHLMWVEDLLLIAKHCASCATHTVLKRPDEKWETEVSYMGGYFDDSLEFVEVGYGGPKFVEDIARGVAEKLDAYLDKEIVDYCIVINNEESIHSGDILATAVLTAGRTLT